MLMVKKTIKTKKPKKLTKKELAKIEADLAIEKRLDISAFSILYYLIIGFIKLVNFGAVFSTNPSNREIRGFIIVLVHLITSVLVFLTIIYGIKTLAMAREAEKKLGVRGFLIYLSFIPGFFLAFVSIFF